MALLRWLLVLPFLIGCGSSGNTTPETPHSAYAYTSKPGGLERPWVVRVLQGAPACKDFLGDASPGGDTELMLLSLCPHRTGVHTIGESCGSADVQVKVQVEHRTLVGGTVVSSATATAGTVTIDGVDPVSGSIKGRYDATFPPDHSMTGTFDAFPCDAAVAGHFDTLTLPDGLADAVDPGAAEVAEEGPDYAGQEFAVCIPGTVKGCSDDNFGRVTCNQEGSGFEVVSCGEDSLCLDSKVGCTKCKPGNKKCQDDDTVLRCDETGSGYVVAEECNGSATGRICQIGSCVKLCDINAKLHSYIGCEYWGADLDNAFVPGGESGFLDAAGSQYAIVVANTSLKYAATVKVYNNEGEVTKDSKGEPFPTDPIQPMGLRIFNLPRRDVNSTVKAPLAYRVVASIPITAYQFNPLENVGVFSNDASILLPSHVLGKYHIVMTREQTFQELKGYLTVIGVYPGEETQVSITVTAPTLADNGIKHLEPGDTYTTTLKQFDVLNIETDAYGADLTGSIVLANHPVVVFGGSEASNAPNTNHCCPGGVC